MLRLWHPVVVPPCLTAGVVLRLLLLVVVVLQVGADKFHVQCPQLADDVLEGRPGQGTRLAVHQGALLERHKCGHRADAGSSRQRGVLVDVDLGEHDVRVLV